MNDQDFEQLNGIGNCIDNNNINNQ